jgi:hypothetical protein
MNRPLSSASEFRRTVWALSFCFLLLSLCFPTVTPADCVLPSGQVSNMAQSLPIIDQLILAQLLNVSSGGTGSETPTPTTGAGTGTGTGTGTEETPSPTTSTGTGAETSSPSLFPSPFHLQQALAPALELEPKKQSPQHQQQARELKKQ